jgi:hypothetical protein
MTEMEIGRGGIEPDFYDQRATRFHESLEFRAKF